MLVITKAFFFSFFNSIGLNSIIGLSFIEFTDIEPSEGNIALTDWTHSGYLKRKNPVQMFPNRINSNGKMLRWS